MVLKITSQKAIKQVNDFLHLSTLMASTGSSLCTISTEHVYTDASLHVCWKILFIEISMYTKIETIQIHKFVIVLLKFCSLYTISLHPFSVTSVYPYSVAVNCSQLSLCPIKTQMCTYYFCTGNVCPVYHIKEM